MSATSMLKIQNQLCPFLQWVITTWACHAHFNQQQAYTYELPKYPTTSTPDIACVWCYDNHPFGSGFSWFEWKEQGFLILYQ
jgi:hypothetical protein